MKRHIALLCVLALAATALAQKPKQGVDFSQDGLPEQLLEYLNKGTSDSGKQKENAKTVKAFQASYSAMDDAMQKRVANLYSYAAKVKMKGTPEMSDMTQVLTAYATAPGGGQNLEGWVSVMEHFKKNASKPKAVMEWVEFSGRMLKERVLYQSNSSRWSFDVQTPFRITMTDGKALVWIDSPADLTYATSSQSNKIHGTTGCYSYKDGRWNGDGGRIDWARTGLGAEACYAELGRYSAATKNAKFSADSVQFVNTHYFSEAIAGRVEDNLGGGNTFPQFHSYKRDFVIKNIMPEVDYSGSFMMHGAKFITASTKHPASLIFNRDGKRQLSVTSFKFSILPDRLVSENATVALYVGDEDSISNTGITVRYTPADRKVSLINNPKRNFYSPFTDSYHELDIYSEVILCNLATGQVDFSSLSAAGATSQTLFESTNCYTYRTYRELQGIDEESPVKRVYDYVGDGNYTFKAKDFSEYIGLDINQTLLMVHNLARHGLVSYDELTGQVTMKEKLEDYMKAFTRSKGFDYDALALESETRGNNARMNFDDSRLEMQGVKQFVVSDSQRVVVYPRGGRITVGRNRSISFDGRIDVGRFVMFVTGADFNYERFGFDLPHVDSLFFFVPKFDNPDTDCLVRTPLYNLVGTLQVDKPDNHCGLTKNKEYPIFNSLENSFVYYDKKDICAGRYDKQRFYYTLHPFTLNSLVDFVTDSLQFNGALTSGGIFPDITYPLSVQRDYYLGFRLETPDGGYPAYGGKGTYSQRIALDHNGLQGAGKLDYLTSTTRSKNFLFLLDSMVATTDTFSVREEQGYPDIQGGRLYQHWLPYADSMAVATLDKGRPFRMYRGDATFRGRIDLMARGTVADGTATVKEGTLVSERFDLQAREMNAEVSDFTLRSIKHNNIAFTAKHVRSHVDYDRRHADLTIVEGPTRTELPIVKEAAYADLFSWEMDKKTLDIFNSTRSTTEGMDAMDIRMRLQKRGDLPGVRFVSTDEKQEGLTYNALRSTFYYEQGELSSHEVFLLTVADAAIAPAADTLHIERGGKMRLLTNATLVFNRDSAWHQVVGADLLVASANRYTGKGYIDYRNDTRKPQRLYLNDISVDGRGVSVAKGNVSDSASFTLSSAFGFAGKVRYEGNQRWPWFEGGVRLLQPCIPKEQLGLLAYAGYTDPDHIHVAVPEQPTDWKGRRIAASILIDKNTMRPMPAFLTGAKVAGNEVIAAHGVLTYLGDRKQYMIGSERKVSNPDAVVEPYLAMSTTDCQVEGEGPVDLTLKRTQASFYAYGTAVCGMQSTVDDHLTTVFGVTFPIAKQVSDALVAALKDDLRLQAVAGTTNAEMRHAMMHHLGADKGAAAYALYSSTGKMSHVPEEMRSMLLFDNIRWQHAPKVGLYYDGKVGIVASGDKPIGLQVKLKAQIAKYGSAQQITLYIEAAKDHWYFFKYDLGGQELTIYSSSGAWLDLVKAIPLEERKIQKEGLGTFRYFVGNNSNEVTNWLTWFSRNVYSEEEEGF